MGKYVVKGCKSMKGKISVLLALMLLMCSVFFAPVQAETVLQDGIEVTLTTDKERYDALETVYAKLTVKNTNSFDVANVTTKITAPAGYLISGDEEAKIGTLSAGEEYQMQIAMRDAGAPAPVLPQTGDDSHGALWSALFVVTVAALCALIRNPQAKRLVSIFLCMAIVGPYMMQAMPARAEANKGEIVVRKTVTMDGKSVTLTGTVTYGGSSKELSLGNTLTIITQPEDQTVSAGKTATFTVVAEGDGLTYQWYYRTSSSGSWKKASSTTASYSIKNSVERNGRQYRCKITDEYGNVEYTEVATLKLPSVKITTQPQSATVSAGKTAKFTVKATGDGLKYQWYYRTSSSGSWKKASSTKSTYSFTMKESHNNRQIRCKVTDQYGKTVTSSTATLKLPAVKITTQPKDQSVAVGATAKFTVKATGDGLKYQWYYKKSGSSTWTKASTTKSTYSFTMKESYNGRQIRCKVTDKYGKTVTSSTAKLTLAVKITTQPKDAWAYDGESAKVSVKATGDGLKYQWYYKDANAAEFTESTTKSASYSVKMNAERDGRVVYCVVTDAYGNSAKTNEVTLDTRFKAKITEQPKDTSAAAGQTATAVIKAEGDGLTYQWYYKDLGTSSFKKSSTVSAEYSTTMNEARDGRKLYCIVTDAYGNTAKSDTVTMTMVNYSYTVNDGKVTITKHLGTGSHAVIPDKIEGYPVTAIGDDAFANNTTLEKVTLPNSIETIGQRAFKGCTGLTSMDTY